MQLIKGTPSQALWSATLGFFIGFAAVSLFGPTASKFKDIMQLSPMQVGLLVAIPALTGSLLRIPFSAWVDTSGGRKPFLTLLLLSIVGIVGLFLTVYLLPAERLGSGFYPLFLVLGVFCGCGIATFSVGISQVSYWHPQRCQGKALAVYAGVGNLAPGLFSLVIPLALGAFGLAGSYLLWLLFLVAGTFVYAFAGCNAPYFQLLQAGKGAEQARVLAREYGQEIFPAGSLRDSLKLSARVWKTWALVAIYFTTFGGFIALTAWFPTYWTSYFGRSVVTAGFLTALYSILTSLVRIIGGILSDKLREGGENTAILALFIMLVGALVMTIAERFELALPGIVLLAFGMGICNAAVFKLVPQEIPQAIGGAAGWVGGLGAFGGFVIPPAMAFAVNDLGQSGYAIGFMVFIFLALFSFAMVWILKYSRETIPAKGAEPLATSRMTEVASGER
ncbi:MAG: MFS transporter [candidate division KSB1 bacterium]|nr:MFS transporter [candidate division KSB1 bacterium]MDZ7300701.1 MFS transporter [candidate division KSB1 bacterium]MDZ7310029.1 MFS transporter [candidate division KSB1 bacterium]